jgi:hypothetical protein
LEGALEREPLRDEERPYALGLADHDSESDLLPLSEMLFLLCGATGFLANDEGGAASCLGVPRPSLLSRAMDEDEDDSADVGVCGTLP